MGNGYSRKRVNNSSVDTTDEVINEQQDEALEFHKSKLLESMRKRRGPKIFQTWPKIFRICPKIFRTCSSPLIDVLGIVFLKLPARMFAYLTVRVLVMCLILSVLYGAVQSDSVQSLFSSGGSAERARDFSTPVPDVTKFYTDSRFITPKPRPGTTVITELADVEKLQEN